MFLHALGGGDLQSYLISLLLSLPIALLALSLHETAHGFAAWKLGDPTARSLGRLTLNPLKHLNPFGTLCMIVAGFGWANPVPINSRYFKKPRRDIALTALAGPVSNVLLSLVFLLLLRFVAYGWLWQMPDISELQSNLIYFFTLILYRGVSMNLSLAIFNLIPFPPLDGSKILGELLPFKLRYQYYNLERYSVFFFIALILVLNRTNFIFIRFCKSYAFLSFIRIFCEFILLINK